MSQFRPDFIEVRGRRLFSVFFPAEGSERRGALLYLPPFAEELNRSRRMISLAARRFAAAGYDVLLLDPFGCGDSDGDLGAVSWDGWLDDARVVGEWLAAKSGGEISLWGLRLGAAMAAEATAAGAIPARRLMLWNPVTAGKAFLTQFLRLRVAAEMAGGGPPLTTAGLREVMSAGTSLEIAGYELSPNLAAAIDAIDLSSLVLPPATAVDWVEVMPESCRPAPAASTRIANIWRGENAVVSVRIVAGEPFWRTPEITVAQELLAVCADSPEPVA